MSYDRLKYGPQVMKTLIAMRKSDPKNPKKLSHTLKNHSTYTHTVRMNETPRFFIIRKYDWFISQRTSQIQIRSKSF